ncbi:sigma-70 family RNA polymerase sigma factor [Methylobacterium oryzihabitans]|jgi:RNA polymerase sigma-70 factor (ECF subfamily)|uniref:RNA polymerase sigma factor n=1 Tax=Methylobacterium oryzihabitans TaxID=2499852 RepID=A0A437NWT4_9HYPH|nr:sigma-70 family RNA polymerase sigma factor [Methylobacterium oryzihabitans]RVU14480.1 sigma-70 family RNA polymerase sigma factor [Methylobacterium oryzihabitans]
MLSNTSADAGSDDLRPSLTASIQRHLGLQLRDAYAVEAGVPAVFKDLIEKLEAALAEQGRVVEPEFRQGMLAALPSLRAFALSLTNNAARADDLVQDTILRAWQNQHRFQPGTNLNAWLFTILRNAFYSEQRKRMREVQDEDGSYAARLFTAPDQGHRLDVQDLRAGLAKLPPDQREALILVGAEGLSYEEVARICGVAIGTIKSRVNRARNRLAEMLGYSDDDLASDRMMQSAMGEGA